MERKNVIYGSYLVCHEYIEEVGEFLGQFFNEDKGEYNHPGWITFFIPNTDFKVNLIKGKDQEITQNMTFEIDASSIENLKKYARKHNCKIDSFIATETGNNYKYHYIEIISPANICKIEISYCEDVKQ